MNLHQETLHDLFEDFTELNYLASDLIQRLDKLTSFLNRRETHKNLPATALELVSHLTKQPAAELSTIKQTLNNALAASKQKNTDIDALIALKSSVADELRVLYSSISSLTIMLDWQSPSFMHTQTSQAGTQTGEINGTINDYKRDRHADAKKYEHAFRAAYIDAPGRLPPRALLTSSGMSALTTILMSLKLDNKLTGPVLAGENIYFQTKLILSDFFNDWIHYADETDADSFLADIRRLQPSVIFLDSLCNTTKIAIPDLPTLLPRISALLHKPAIIVIDNTGFGPLYQPLRDLPLRSEKLDIVIFESLQKYYQFGMDRVTGGVMWSRCISPLGLDGWRMHLGTNISDTNVTSLPPPNRKLLETRMKRMSRNALLISEYLEKSIHNNHHSRLSHVVFPGLPTHPAFNRLKKIKFYGSYFVLVFKKGFDNPRVYKQFIASAIKEARRARIQLVAGTSFGFNATRVYLTALHANKAAQPFIRISCGTETRAEAETLARVFEAAAENL